MGRKARPGQGNFWTGWFGGQKPMPFGTTVVPVAVYNDSSHFIADDTAADVRALIMRSLPTAGVGNHRGIRLTPVGVPLLLIWHGIGSTGADVTQFRVAPVADRPTEAAQTLLTSRFSQGSLSAVAFQTSVATANLPANSEKNFESTTQTGTIALVPDFRYGMLIVPLGSEFSMWSTVADEASDMGIEWREFPNL